MDTTNIQQYRATSTATRTGPQGAVPVTVEAAAGEDCECVIVCVYACMHVCVYVCM